jgi:predicted DNA-binding transcriptional regulator AlpA
MSDRNLVLVAVPGLGVLAREVKALSTALAEGAKLCASSGAAAPQAPAPSPAGTFPRLLSAKEMEAATGVPASWFAAQARERRIPFRKIGRYVRFSLEEIQGYEGFQRRAIPPGQLNCTGHTDRKGRISG